MSEIEKSFASTTALILGAELAPLAAYAIWLERGLPFPMTVVRSRVSKRPVLVISHPAYARIQGNIAGIEEALELGKRALSEKEAEGLSLANAARTLSKISTTCPNVVFGENFDTAESTCYGPTQHCFRISYSWWSKYASCCYDVRTSAHVHGCSDLDDCNFCIRCRQSSKLQRCFEVDESSSCSDCYFCHNVENCRDCMFCFNAKNLKNAIGNVEYPREEYLAMKKKVLAKMVEELKATRQLKRDIYSVGEKHGKK
ncbi:MAG: hypothetical protein WC861_00650 [Candidatus Micrarchaeia archaeon]|jgi:hypothetical protein